MSSDDREDWKLSDYPEVEPDDVDFPKTIKITLALCGDDCGGGEFIVKGSTLICDYCHKQRMCFGEKEYVLSDEKVEFP